MQDLFRQPRRQKDVLHLVVHSPAKVKKTMEVSFLKKKMTKEQEQEPSSS